MAADERLGDLLLRWEELQARGQSVSTEELCREAPDLLDELRRCVEVLQRMKPALDVPARAETVDQSSSERTAASDPSDPVPPAAVPGYEILGVLGRGGMGVVYKARQKSLDRVVALKMILAGAHAGTNQRLRFQAEAESAARLQHPNIAQVYEIGEQDGCPYFSLEYVDGRGLHEELQEGLPPPMRSAALTEQLARAVAYAHQHGIVHRDLKPGNVLLTPDGTPKITDFGLAKRLDDDQGHTRTGDVIGTPSYMAPEQAAGRSKEVGPAADVYALGAILYEMLTGQPPFEGGSTWDTVLLVLSAEPEPPSRRQPGVPRDLETICLKCLQKEPAKRYASALTLADDLRRFQIGEPIEARPVGSLERARKWARRRPAVATLLATSAALLLALLVGGWVTAVRVAQNNRDLEKVNRANLRALIRLNVTNGSHHVEDEDLIGSLVWYARANKLEDDDAVKPAHRTRLAAVLRECPRLRQLWFHDEAVNDVAFSPDGKWVVTAGDDRTARVWNIETGVPRFAPLSHTGAIVRASFSPDGQRIVTTGTDDTGRIWDAVTGRLIATLTGHRGPVRDARFSPDSSLVVTASADATARVWNAADGKLRGASLIHEGEVVRASFDRDGQRVLTACSDGFARVWRLDAERSVIQFRLKHGGPVTDAVFSADGTRVATASADGTARIWDSATGKPIGEPLRHQGEVLRVAFRGDGRQLATASADLSARIWDSATGQELTPALRHYSTVISVAFSPDGTHLATASDDNSARVWDTSNGRSVTPPLPHNGSVSEVCFSPDGRHIATAARDTTARIYDLELFPPAALTLHQGGAVLHASFDADGTRVLTTGTDRKARVWNARTGKVLAILEGHTAAILTGAFSHDGSRIVTAGADRSARVWDASDYGLIATLMGHQGPITRAAFSPDGTRVVTASDDGTARAWDAATGVSEAVLGDGGGGQRQAMLDAVFSPDGRSVATGSADRTARLWDMTGGRQLGPPLNHSDRVVRVAFSPDGRQLATASFDRTAQLWDVATGQAVLQNPMAHAGSLRDLSFSPDGALLATCGDDNTVRVWKAATGVPFLPPLRHFGTVLAVRFSPDGKRLASASADNSGRVWDAATGEPLTPPLSHRGWSRIEDVAFNPAGDQLVTASADGTAQLWRLAPSTWPPDDLEKLAELLSGSRISADAGSLTPLNAEELRRLWDELGARYLRDTETGP
jgi:eukaryotic-like serine/threonine-protein kinase